MSLTRRAVLQKGISEDVGSRKDQNSQPWEKRDELNRSRFHDTIAHQRPYNHVAPSVSLCSNPHLKTSVLSAMNQLDVLCPSATYIDAP